MTAAKQGKQAKPTIKRRRIGSLLRRYREECKPRVLSKAAAQHIGVDPVLLGRIERGEYRIKPDQISGLLDLYGIDNPAAHEELFRAAVEPLDSGWWYPYRNQLNSSFLDFITLEDEALEIKDVIPSGIPGLLQCMEYAQEIQETSSLPWVRSEADMYVAVRMARQQVITRRKNPAFLHCVMAESTLHSESPSMGKQIAHMLSVSRRDNVELQIMPLKAAAGLHIDVQGVLLKFRDPWTQVAYTPGYGNGYLRDDPNVPRDFNIRFEHVSKHALSVEQTREFLKERLKEINYED